VFHENNEGLVVAELELSSDDEHFDRPEWLGEEVTGRPQYYNANLIK
jgi:adenylate cyclase